MKTALKLLAYTTIPATYDEAVYWITRMLAHFPRRDSQKDGVLIADLSAAIVEDQSSLIAVAAICEEAWKSSRDDSPWPPTSGQLLEDIKRRTNSYRGLAGRWDGSTPQITNARRA